MRDISQRDTGLWHFLLMSALLLICVGLEYWLHVAYGINYIYPHLFYIPIFIAALWWGLKGGFVVSLFIALMHAASYFAGPDQIAILRCLAFVLVGSAAGILCERRRRAERRAEHLTSVLKAIRNVNQLIIAEKDRDRLLQAACNVLTEARGYEATWLAYLKDDGTFAGVLGSGFSEDMLRFSEHILSGNYPPCISKALKQEKVSRVSVVEDKFKECEDCFFRDEYVSRKVANICIEHDGRLFGLLAILLSPDVVVDNQEKGLLKEVSSDIAFALHGIELEEERKKAEEALRESEQRYRALLDLGAEVGEAVVMIQDTEKGDGIQTFINDEWPRITGYTREELLNMSFFELIHPEDREASKERHRRKMKGEIIPGLFELLIIRKDGNEVPVELTSAYTTYKGERANVIYLRDIAKRKQMEEQLIVNDRLASIGELASGVAHELNNPLTGIIGIAELLLENDVPDDVRGDLEVINREAKRTATVVRNLLTFARKREPAKQPTNINKVIETALEVRAYEQKVSNIEVNTQFAPDLPEILADGFELQQVFLNIIINAEYFMIEAHGRGVFTITTEKVGDIIRASFADDGPGVSKENLGHLFDPFFTTKEVGKGTGLGLSICHGIVAEHGGRIYAESELGKGTTFIVELPINIGNIEVTVK